jgi:hypothetical protein
MDGLIPFPPDKSQGEKQHKRRGQKSRRRKAGQVMGQRECLEALSRLPGLLMMGIIEPTKSNAICSVLKAILSQHQIEHSKTSGSGLNGFDIIGVLRARPDLMSLLEPLLTDDQLDILTKDAMDGDDVEN